MKNQKRYINKKGSIKAVIAACVATVICAGSLGLGSAQIINGFFEMLIYDSSSPGFGLFNTTGPRISEDIDRDLWRGITQVTSQSQGRPETEFSAVELFEERSSTIVGIRLVQPSIGGGTRETDIIGSGVIISPDGFIITNSHVIDSGTEVIVVVDDYDDPNIRHDFMATVYGHDAPTDLALLKITRDRDEPFRFSPVGSSGELRVGQSVVAIGNPVGFEKTMTKGIVSGLQRDLEMSPFMLPSIQTDAAVNPGNSGCPLFNMYGEVVGIVNIKLFSPGGLIDNLGFAISIDEAIPIIYDLGRHGRVASRAMLGITAQPYFDGTYEGLEVISISQGSPAAESGLSRNDIIVAIEGEVVRSVADIQSVVRNKVPGDVIELTIVRYNNYGDASELTVRFALIGATG